MENKQTPVEWLITEIIKHGLVPQGTHPDNILFHKAKEMESTLMEELKDFEKWKEWINGFGKIIEINCDPSQELQYDKQQNGILVDYLDKLTAA